MMLTKREDIIKNMIETMDESTLDVFHYVLKFNPLCGYDYTICDTYTLKELLLDIKRTNAYNTLEILTERQLKFTMSALYVLYTNTDCVENTWKSIQKGLLHYPIPLI